MRFNENKTEQNTKIKTEIEKRKKSLKKLHDLRIPQNAFLFYLARLAGTLCFIFNAIRAHPRYI